MTTTRKIIYMPGYGIEYSEFAVISILTGDGNV
jgi:hypothetical protein